MYNTQETLLQVFFLPAVKVFTMFTSIASFSMTGISHKHYNFLHCECVHIFFHLDQRVHCKRNTIFKLLLNPHKLFAGVLLFYLNCLSRRAVIMINTFLYRYVPWGKRSMGQPSVPSGSLPETVGSGSRVCPG